MELMNKLASYNDMSDTDIMMLSPLVWAFIGDAVYELYVRTYVTGCSKKTSENLHKTSIEYVRAEAQSSVLEEILPILTDEEQNIVRRGRNTKTAHLPKNASMIDYRRATALEALVGYLYLLKRYDRLDEIMRSAFERKAASEELGEKI